MNSRTLVAMMSVVMIPFLGCGPNSHSDASASSSKASPPSIETQNINSPVNSSPDSTNEIAVIKTNLGEMTLEFWSDIAPGTVANFKKLAKDNFYNGTAFHRIMKGFMIQGGDPLTKDKSQESYWGTGGPGYTIKAEFNKRKHVRGVISMARSSDPNSAGSQFFICLDDATFLDGEYTAFGQLIGGDDVLGKIGNVPCALGSGGEVSKPTQRIEVESITIRKPSE